MQALNFRVASITKQVVADSPVEDLSEAERNLRIIRDVVAKQLTTDTEKIYVPELRMWLFFKISQGICGECKSWSRVYDDGGECQNPQVRELEQSIRPIWRSRHWRGLNSRCTQWFEPATLDDLRNSLEEAKANYLRPWGSESEYFALPSLLQMVATWEFIVQRREQSEFCGKNIKI